MNHNKLIAFIGPSGAGKSTNVERLVSETDVELVRTYTTRPRRHDGEHDTHVFVKRQEFEQLQYEHHFLGTGSLGSDLYGLPHLPHARHNHAQGVILRAPFIPEVKLLRPDAVVVQFEASIDTIVSRLESRGDIDRIDPERIRQEIAFGRKLADYVISTDISPDDAYAQLLEILRNIHAIDAIS